MSFSKELDDLCKHFGYKSQSLNVSQLLQINGLSISISEVKVQLGELLERWICDGCDIIARLLQSNIHSLEKIISYHQNHMKRSDKLVDPFIIWNMVDLLLKVSDIPPSLSELLSYQSNLEKIHTFESCIQSIKNELNPITFSGSHWMTSFENDKDQHLSEIDVIETISTPLLPLSLKLYGIERSKFLEVRNLQVNPSILIIKEILDHMSGNPTWTFLYRLNDGSINISPFIHLESHLSSIIIQNSLSQVLKILQKIDEIRIKYSLFVQISSDYSNLLIVSGLSHSIRFFLTQIIQPWITSYNPISCINTSLLSFSIHYSREWFKIVSWMHKMVDISYDISSEANAIAILSCRIYDAIYKELYDNIQYYHFSNPRSIEDINIIKMASYIHEFVISPYDSKFKRWIEYGTLNSMDNEFPIFHNNHESSIKILLRTNDQPSIYITELFNNVQFFLPSVIIPLRYKSNSLIEQIKRGWYLFTLQSSIEVNNHSHSITLQQIQLLETIISFLLPIPSKFHDELIELFRMNHSSIKSISHLAFCIQERLGDCPIAITYSNEQSESVYSCLEKIRFEWPNCDKVVCWLLNPLKEYLQRICKEWICILYLKSQLEYIYFDNRLDKIYQKVLFLIKGIWHHVSSSLNQLFSQYRMKFVSCIFDMQNICFNLVSDCLASMFFENIDGSYDTLYYMHMEKVPKIDLQMNPIGISLNNIFSLTLRYLWNDISINDELNIQCSFLYSILKDISLASKIL